MDSELPLPAASKKRQGLCRLLDLPTEIQLNILYRLSRIDAYHPTMLKLLEIPQLAAIIQFDAATFLRIPGLLYSYPLGKDCQQVLITTVSIILQSSTASLFDTVGLEDFVDRSLQLRTELNIPKGVETLVFVRLYYALLANAELLTRHYIYYMRTWRTYPKLHDEPFKAQAFATEATHNYTLRAFLRLQLYTKLCDLDSGERKRGQFLTAGCSCIPTATAHEELKLVLEWLKYQAEDIDQFNRGRWSPLLDAALVRTLSNPNKARRTLLAERCVRWENHPRPTPSGIRVSLF